MVLHLFSFMCHVGAEADHLITYPGRKNSVIRAEKAFHKER